MQPQRNSLSILVNPPTPISFGRYQLEVTPLTAAELPKVLHHVGVLLPLLDSVQSIEDCVALLADHGDALLAVCAIGARLPREQVDALMPDEVAELLLALIEVNMDFFGPRLARLRAQADGLAERMRARVPPTSTGPTPSPV